MLIWLLQTLHICEEGTDLPFDIKDSRTIFYRNDMLGVDELKEVLETMLCEIDYTKDYKDNPIYNARAVNSIMKESGGENLGALIISRLDSINAYIANIQKRESNSSKRMREYEGVSVTKLEDSPQVILSPKYYELFKDSPIFKNSQKYLK